MQKNEIFLQIAIVFEKKIGTIPKALGNTAENEQKEAMKMKRAQYLFQIFLKHIYRSGFSAAVINGKNCELNESRIMAVIEEQATQFLYRQDYREWEIQDIKFGGYATDYLDEMYPEILREIENDTVEEYAFGILGNLEIEKKDLKSIEFKV